MPCIVSVFYSSFIVMQLISKSECAKRNVQCHRLQKLGHNQAFQFPQLTGNCRNHNNFEIKLSLQWDSNPEPVDSVPTLDYCTPPHLYVEQYQASVYVFCLLLYVKRCFNTNRVMAVHRTHLEVKTQPTSRTMSANDASMIDLGTLWLGFVLRCSSEQSLPSGQSNGAITTGTRSAGKSSKKKYT